MNAIYDSELYHHGVKGQKWGVRRYQNADGSLTPAGKKRRYKEAAGVDKAKAAKKEAYRKYSNSFDAAYNYDKRPFLLKNKSRSKKNWEDVDSAYENFKTKNTSYKSAKKEYKENVKNDPELQAHRAAVRKKVAIAAGATALAAVGAYTLHKTGADKKIADSVIQAGRGMSKKAYNKYYDRPIDTKARVITPKPQSFKALPKPPKSPGKARQAANKINEFRANRQEKRAQDKRIRDSLNKWYAENGYSHAVESGGLGSRLKNRKK